MCGSSGRFFLYRRESERTLPGGRDRASACHIRSASFGAQRLAVSALVPFARSAPCRLHDLRRVRRSVLRPVRLLLPPYYYLMAVHDKRYFLYIE